MQRKNGRPDMARPGGADVNAACPGGGTATATLNPGNGGGSTNVTLAETPAGSGIYVGGNSAPLNPGHDTSTITVTVPSCPGDNLVNIPVFIDPSGHIVTSNLLPIQGATVTVLRSTSGTANGPFAPAPADTIIPTTNPETTDATGAFRWDVLSGFYKVQASAPGCTSFTTPALPVPPPQVDLLIRLTCQNGAPGIVLPKPGSGSGGDNLPVTLTVRPTGITPWNKILPPGVSTTSTGFCAVP
jgi:carboxypeptidase family protein